MLFDLFPPMIHGTLREHYLLLFGGAGLFALAVGGIGAWVGAWIGARRASRRVLEEMRRERAGLDEARHATLAQGIEAIALEVERISEAQRFATRLLSERAPAPSLPPVRREPGVTTPH